MAARSLDTVLSQVVIDYFDDATFQWHHRVLLVQLEGPRWIVVTPDGNVHVLDLSAHRVIPVRRNSAFPDSVRGNVYIFDPFEDGEEEGYLAQAVTLARIMGVTPALGVGGLPGRSWRVSDPAREDFDSEVPSVEMVDPEKAVIRENIGLWMTQDPLLGDVWVHVERVADADHEDWLLAKRAGPGRDERIAVVVRDGQQRRFVPLRQSLGSARITTFTDWPYEGPRASEELLPAVMKAGFELSQYDGHWSTRSGVHVSSAAAITHKNIFQALSLGQAYDQVEVHDPVDDAALPLTAGLRGARLLHGSRARRHGRGHHVEVCGVRG